jgi:sister chromatid cohesion protein PDS5
MSIFLRRSSLRVINQSSIPTLIKNVQRADPDDDGRSPSQAQLSAKNAHAILTYVSRHCPSLHKLHVTELVKAIADEKKPKLVDVFLHALSSLAQWDKALVPTDKSVNYCTLILSLTLSYRRFVDRITRFVLESGHKRAKFSARLLCCFKNRDDLCAEAVNVCDLVYSALTGI